MKEFTHPDAYTKINRSYSHYTFRLMPDEIGPMPTPNYRETKFKHDILCPNPSVSAFIPKVEDGVIGTFTYIDGIGGPHDFDEDELAFIDHQLSTVIDEERKFYDSVDWDDGRGEFGISTHWNHDLIPLPPSAGVGKGFTWTFENHHLRYGKVEMITYRRGIIVLGKEDSVMINSSRRAFPDDTSAGPLTWEEALHNLRYKGGLRYQDRTPEDWDNEKAHQVDLNYFVFDLTLCNSRPEIRHKLGMRLGDYDWELDTVIKQNEK